MTDYAPATLTLTAAPLASTAAAADASGRYLVAPFAGKVTAVKMIAAAALTGANTDSRTIQVYNRGALGSGTTKLAETAYTSGVNLTADKLNTVAVITTASADVVAAGDVLEFVSLHVGATGLAGPELTPVVTFDASYS